MNGYQRSPISTGMMPTYVPRSAKSETCDASGCGVGAAVATARANLVPSDVVIPTS